MQALQHLPQQGFELFLGGGGRGTEDHDEGRERSLWISLCAEPGQLLTYLLQFLNIGHLLHHHDVCGAPSEQRPGTQARVLRVGDHLSQGAYDGPVRAAVQIPLGGAAQVRR